MADERSNPSPSSSHKLIIAYGSDELPELKRQSREFGAAWWVADWGRRESTCRGPVKSSCVKSGKMIKPILKGDMFDLQSSTLERCVGVALCRYFGEIIS